MTTADIILGAALLLALLAWCLRPLPARSWLLAAGIAAALAAGLHDIRQDRWQAWAGVAAALVLLLALVIGRWRRRPLRTGWHVAGSVALALPVLIAVAALAMFPVSPLPAPSGQHSVGMRDFMLTDTSRTGVLNAAADEPRRLLVRVWYPAAPVPGAQPRQYFSDAETRVMVRGLGELVGFPPLLTHLRLVRTNTYENAPLATTNGHWPVIFFDHGYAAYTGASQALMETLASHGYLVYAVQHAGDAAPTLLPDGRALATDPALVTHMRYFLEHGMPADVVRGFTSHDLGQRLDGQLAHITGVRPPADRGYAVSAPVWLADRLFVHDALQAGRVPASVGDIVAASELTRTGAAGISFGGSTSAAVCLVDPRCAAAVNLDGGDFHAAGFDTDMPVPMLMFMADLRGFYRLFGAEAPADARSLNDFSYERFEHAGQGRDMHRMQLLDSVHAGLTDNPLFLRRPLRDALFGTAPADVLVGVTNDTVLAFFDHYLRGAGNGFPQAQYRQHADRLKPYDNSPVRRWWQALPAGERTAIEARIAAMQQMRHAGATAGKTP